jgi:hypothetical protein
MGTTRIGTSLGMFMLAAALVALGGCGRNVPFDLMQEGYAAKPGTLAVVSGGTDDADVRFAEHLTKSLQQRSTLKVLSQAEVDRRAGKYPVNIKWTAQPKDAEHPVWYAPNEKARIDAIQAAVKTDYVLVVWVANLSRYTTTSSRGGTSVSYGASIIGNLVHYGPGKAVGYTDFGASKGQSCCLFGGSVGKDIDDLLRFSAEEIADKVAERTRTAKP